MKKHLFGNSTVCEEHYQAGKIFQAHNHKQYVLELNNVFVFDYGLITDSNFKPIDDANVNYNLWNTFLGLTANDKIQPKNIISLDDKNYIFAHGYLDCCTFGHIWDTIQQLEKIETLNISNSCLLCNNVNSLQKHFDIFGYSKDKLFECDRWFLKQGGAYKVAKLWYSSPCTNPARVTKELREWLVKKYAKKTKTINDTKLWLSRPEFKRHALNEKEVLDVLKEHNFTIITGDECIKYLIEQFSAAKLIIGTHGSLFRNILFCERKPTVIEFCPLKRLDTTLKLIGEISNCNYVLIATESDNNFNMNIDIRLLKNLIKM